MRTELRAGAVLETVSVDELRTTLEEIASGYLRDPYRVRINAGGKTDESGNATIDVTRPARPGFVFLVNRVVVHPDGYTYEVPYTSAGALELIRAPGPGTVALGEVLDGYLFGGTSGGILPCAYTCGDDRAIDLLDGEVLQVKIFAGPASQAVTIRGHGTMIPLPDQAAY